MCLFNFFCVSEWVHLQLQLGEVLVLLCSSFSWLWPRQTVVVPGPRLMSGFAALQRTIPPCWCEAADHHIGPTLLQSYKSPTVRPGPNGTATAGDGQVHQEEGWGKHGGRRWCRGGNESVSTVLCVHLHLWPHKAALLALYPTSANATTIHNILSTSGPSPAAPFNCLY